MIDAIKAAIWAELVNIHTALPGKIEKYDYTTKKADVKPLIKKKLRDGKVLSLPVITNVPVIFPAGKDTSITWPLQKGDPVLIIFSERCLERWLSSGGDEEPGDPRKFDLSDAVAIPGLFSFAATSAADNNTDFLVKHKQSEIRITGQNAITVKNSVGTLKITSDGKVAIGNSTAELLNMLSRFMDLVATGNCVIGSPISTAATIAALKLIVDNSLKGSI